MIEEIGEGWNVVKHLEKDEKLLRKVITDNQVELEDFIGDLGFLVLKLSHVLDVDAEKAIRERLIEFEERFPAEFMRKNTFAGNRKAGGVDMKYQKKQG
jgi:NTP pyrophosphatase (non-canonical NTP hydrolase)